jgi:4-aminobutyrate aminotransferase-like enzyme
MPVTAAESSLLQRRQRSLGPAYSLFYEQPVHLVRGEGAWLFDPAGRRYLDCYNNVASVGHCHPRVVDALSRQAATLNTHTRYLHEGIVNYAERLAATLPEPLSVCMFVCTGTEANDLALRIARAVTGNHGIVVTEDAYHGNSTAVFEMSTEEYPARDRPAYLRAVAAPCTYRGPFRDLGRATGADGGEAPVCYAALVTISRPWQRAGAARRSSSPTTPSAPTVCSRRHPVTCASPTGSSERPAG